jgi:hypothetical protein
MLSLLLVLFNKAFFPDQNFYNTWVWPLNMLFLGMASIGIFRERETWIQWIRNFLFFFSISIPLVFGWIVEFPTLVLLAFLSYSLYYSLILTEVLRQITRRAEGTGSVVIGSVCGFLLLIVVAQFGFLTIEYHQPGSFNGLHGTDIPSLYSQLSYFSMVTLATIGYGDITPKSELARLVTMFFAICGQFYMVALVGIIISRYTTGRRTG